MHRYTYFRRENGALIIGGFVIDIIKDYIGHMRGTDQVPLMKWQKVIPDDKAANSILFEDSPSPGVVRATSR